MASLVKSTNVRMAKAQFALWRGALQHLSQFAPEWAARGALWLFSRPPRARERAAQRALRRQADWVPLWHPEARWLNRPETAARAWVWGDGPRTVLLLHGWGGWASQFAPWIVALRERGYRVVAVEAPGHGPGRHGPVLVSHFISALHLAVRQFGPFDGAVGHSLGGAAITLAVSEGVPLGRVVLLAAPSNLERVMRGFGRALGLDDAVVQRFLHRVAEGVGLSPYDVDGRAARRNGHAPVLLIHDQDDREVPVASAEALATQWPGARRWTTRGLGHRRLLAAEEVVAAGTAFLAGEAAPGRHACRVQRDGL